MLSCKVEIKHSLFGIFKILYVKQQKVLLNDFNNIIMKSQSHFMKKHKKNKHGMIIVRTDT